MTPDHPHPFSIRAVTPSDEPFLWEMLTHAASMDPPGPASVSAAKSDPHLSVYVASWGRPGDLGVLALSPASRPLAAAWLRLAPAPSPFHLATPTTPELAIATLPEARARGLGTALLRAVIAAARPHYPAIVLSVRKGNPAVRLYERFGFTPQKEIQNRVGTISQTMHLPLTPPTPPQVEPPGGG